MMKHRKPWYILWSPKLKLLLILSI